MSLKNLKMSRYIIVLFIQFFFYHQLIAQEVDYDSTILIRNCVVLDAKESIQEERDDLIYKWNFGDGAIGVGEVVEHCYDVLGTYEVNLTIVDPELLIMTDNEWLFEVVINADYSLSMGVNKGNKNKIRLSSNLAYQDKPDQVNYFWDFGDGNYGVGENLTHSYSEAGNYSVRLLAKVEFEGEILSISTKQKIQID